MLLLKHKEEAAKGMDFIGTIKRVASERLEVLLKCGESKI